MSASRPTLRVTITAALAVMAGGTALVITLLTYRSARTHLLESYRVVLAQVAERISERARGYLGPVKNAAAASARLLESGAIAPADADAVEALFFAQMEEYHRFASLDLGTAEGAFLMVKRMPDGGLSTQTVQPGRGAQWRLRAAGAGLREVKETRPDPGAAGYDPRVRPWYRAGLAAPDDVGWTDVYALATDRRLAVSASRAVRTEAGPVAVVSASMTLDEIDRFLATLRLGPRGRAFVVDRSGRLVGHPEGVVLRADASGTLVVPSMSDCGDGALAALARTPAFRGVLEGGAALEMHAFDAEGEPWLATVVPLSYAVGQGWFVGAVVPEDDLLGPVRADLYRTLALCAGVGLLGLGLALFIGRGIARPLHLVAEEATRIRGFDFASRPRPESPFSEVHEIVEAFAGMKVGLRALEKYVPTRLVRVLLESGEEPRLGGRSAEATVFFSDLKGFSTLAESLPPAQLAIELGAYLGLVAETITEAEGTVDKYIGDAVMAFWNAPRPVPDHPYVAVACALRALERVRATDPGDRFHTCIGLHVAEVSVGNFGSADRLSYTVMGDGVNLASRLEGVNRKYGTQILVSEDLYRRIEGRIECRRIDRIAVKGRAGATLIYEPLGLPGAVDPTRLARARRYEDALEAYFARDFARALALLADLVDEDGPAHTLDERARRYLATPPPEDWTGVHALTEK